MLPTTVELLRDILQEAEFLSTYAAQTCNQIVWDLAANKATDLAARLRPILGQY